MRRWLWAIVLALTTVAPTAAAGPNDPAMAVTASQGPDTLEPGGEEGAWNLTVRYHWVAPTPEEVTVRLEPGDLGLYDARVDPAVFTFRPALEVDGPRDRSVTRDATLHVAADADAPAYRAQSLPVEATAEPTRTQDRVESETRATLVPSFRPGLDVEADPTDLTVPEGEAVRVSAELGNAANGATRIHYGPIDAPDGCQVHPLNESHLLERNETREAAFDLTCEAGAEGGPLAVTYAQAYAPDPSIEGPPVTQTWHVEVDNAPGASAQAAVLGTSASVAGLPVGAWLLVALAVVAGARRVVDS